MNRTLTNLVTNAIFSQCKLHITGVLQILTPSRSFLGLAGIIILAFTSRFSTFTTAGFNEMFLGPVPLVWEVWSCGMFLRGQHLFANSEKLLNTYPKTSRHLLSNVVDVWTRPNIFEQLCIKEELRHNCYWTQRPMPSFYSYFRHHWLLW